MGIHRNIDDWFLGYKTRAVKARDGGGGLYSGRSGRSKPTKPLKAGSGLANLRAAALKHPEVMVKIPKRLSGNSKGMLGVRNPLPRGICMDMQLCWIVWGLGLAKI